MLILKLKHSYLGKELKYFKNYVASTQETYVFIKHIIIGLFAVN